MSSGSLPLTPAAQDAHQRYMASRPNQPRVTGTSPEAARILAAYEPTRHHAEPDTAGKPTVMNVVHQALTATGPTTVHVLAAHTGIPVRKVHGALAGLKRTGRAMNDPDPAGKRPGHWWAT